MTSTEGRSTHGNMQKSKTVTDEGKQNSRMMRKKIEKRFKKYFKTEYE